MSFVAIDGANSANSFCIKFVCIAKSCFNNFNCFCYYYSWFLYNKYHSEKPVEVLQVDTIEEDFEEEAVVEDVPQGLCGYFQTYVKPYLTHVIAAATFIVMAAGKRRLIS